MRARAILALEATKTSAKNNLPEWLPTWHFWLLLSLPWLLAGVNSSWLYVFPEFVDSWLNLGYFQHFVEFKTRLFPDLYYGTRLPWLIPGYLIHRVFEPATAKYVLHFGFYYLAVLSVYDLLRRAIGRQNALIGAIVFGSHWAFLRAIGWDYVDGAGIVYNLLAMSCIARATTLRATQSPARRTWLVAAGMGSAAMVYTNLSLLMFVPFHLALCVFLFSKPELRSILRAFGMLPYLIAGIAVLSIALGVLNYRLDGNIWFDAPSIRAARALRSPFPWRHAGWTWLRGAFWLGLPAAALLASLVTIPIHWRRRDLAWGDLKTFFILQWPAAACGMGLSYVFSGAGLQFDAYVSYLLPSMFLSVGVMLAASGDGWKPRQHAVAAIGGVFVFAGALWLCGPLSIQLRSPGFVTVIACLSVTLILRTALAGKWYTVVPIFAALAVFQTGFSGFPDRSEGYRDVWTRIVQGADLAWPYVRTRSAQFWFDKNEPYSAEFQAINSVYLWQYSQVGAEFPAVSKPEALQASTTIALLTALPDAVERANAALTPYHLKSSVLAAHKIRYGGAGYNLVVLELEDANSVRQLSVVETNGVRELRPAPAGAPPDLPLAAWKLAHYPDGQPRLEQGPDGVRVTTIGRRFAYGTSYGPLVAARSGSYRFQLRYQVISGGIDFGALSGDESRHIGNATLALPSHKVQTGVCVVKLKKGEGVVLLIANNPPVHEEASTYRIESVRASAVFED